MTVGYIRLAGDRSIVLSVMEAGQSLRLTAAPKLIERTGAMSKAIGVFTKADRLSTDEAWDEMREHLENYGTEQLPKLDRGYIATMCLPPRKSENFGPSRAAKRQGEREQLMLKANGVGDLVQAGKASCDALIHTMMNAYLEFITADKWKKTIEETVYPAIVIGLVRV